MGIIANMQSFLINIVSWIISFFLTRCMHIKNNDFTLATSQNYIWHNITNKIYSPKGWYYSVVYKNSCSKSILFVFLFSIDKYNPLLLQCPIYPTKSNLNLAYSLAAVVGEPGLFRLVTFHEPNRISPFHCLGRTEASVQFRGTCYVS